MLDRFRLSRITWNFLFQGWERWQQGDFGRQGPGSYRVSCSGSVRRHHCNLATHWVGALALIQGQKVSNNFMIQNLKNKQLNYLLRILKWHLLLHFGRRTKWRRRELVLLRRSKSSFTKRDEWMTGSLSPGKLDYKSMHLKQNAICHSFWAVSFTLQQFGKP